MGSGVSDAWGGAFGDAWGASWGSGSTPTPTPTPVVATPASLGGVASQPIQDRYWRSLERRFEKKKKQALQKSPEAVDIVEEIASTQNIAAEALARLAVELERSNIREAAIYRDLLKLELEIKQRDEEVDDEDVILLAVH